MPTKSRRSPHTQAEEGAKPDILPAQCRAGRALVDLALNELARRAVVSRNVVASFESGVSTPSRDNLAALRGVLEEAGVEFTDGEAPGVRLRKGEA
jgi:transcriptional regulator with XRE-family HTH domain